MPTQSILNSRVSINFHYTNQIKVIIILDLTVLSVRNTSILLSMPEQDMLFKTTNLILTSWHLLKPFQIFNVWVSASLCIYWLLCIPPTLTFPFHPYSLFLYLSSTLSFYFLKNAIPHTKWLVLGKLMLLHYIHYQKNK